jgi:hypothetical protein
MVCRCRLALSPGEAHDVWLAGKLLSRLKVGSMLLADRGLDQRACPEEGGLGQHPAQKQSHRSDLLQPLSLPRSQPGRAVLQQDQTCRRVATRYDRLAANYLAFVQLASIRLWLRLNESAS